MQITEVRIKLVGHSEDRLLAFCSITFDFAFVVRDLKIIEGTQGLFVAMPSRKITAPCTSCGYKNALRAAHCNRCGADIRDVTDPRGDEGRRSMYADIAHPIPADCRDMIERAVLAEYQVELERAKSPEYVCRYDHEYRVEDMNKREAAITTIRVEESGVPSTPSPIPADAKPRDVFPGAPHYRGSPGRSNTGHSETRRDEMTGGARPTPPSGCATSPTRS